MCGKGEWTQGRAAWEEPWGLLAEPVPSRVPGSGSMTPAHRQEFGDAAGRSVGPGAMHLCPFLRMLYAFLVHEYWFHDGFHFCLNNPQITQPKKCRSRSEPICLLGDALSITDAR